MDLIILFFLVRNIGTLALKKGLKTFSWKLYTVLAWITGEIIGIGMAVNLFGPFNINNIDLRYGLMGLFFAFGGYLLIRFILEKKPDSLDDDIKGIGVDDLKP